MAPVAFSSLKPQLFVEAPKAAHAVQFYKAAFGAEELKCAAHPKCKAEQDTPPLLCAELKLGHSVLMVCDLIDESATLTPNGAIFSLCLVTDDVEAAVANAVKAGAVVVEEVSDEDRGCCGARSGKVKDPFGFVWSICAVGKSCC